MEIQVLVAYGTKYGGTAEIAEKIGEALTQAGVGAKVVAADQAGDVSPYTAVVLGSAVYMGQWRKGAANFLKANEAKLAERPVWLFSSGPTGEGDPVQLLSGWRFPTGLQPIAGRIGPRDMAIFGGVADPQKLSFFDKLILKMVKAPMGDVRDWEAIASWATAIAEALKEEGA